MANMTLEDIVNISFPKANFGGYRAEEVDVFIDGVQASYSNLLKENEELKRKLGLLAQKIEEYRNDEDSIRNTLLTAQKMADASIREAKHKAEVIVADATEKAERIILGAQKEAEDRKGELGRLKDEVNAFRVKLLGIYKEHLQMIQQLPVEDEEQKAKEEEVPETKEQEPSKENTAAEEVPERETFPEGKPEEIVSRKEMEITKVYEPVGYAESVSPAEPATPQEIVQPVEDQISSRFSSLKFGDDYDVKSDTESPVDAMFKKRK